jgi:hypothetical protein
VIFLGFVFIHGTIMLLGKKPDNFTRNPVEKSTHILPGNVPKITSDVLR